jgi:hypothetical protein
VRAATWKSEVESALSRRLGASFKPKEKSLPEAITTGISEIDSLAGGIPRGRITEIFGPASSGRTTMLLSVMAQATARQEVCALVDTQDRLDPLSAATAGMNLDRLLWVRCSGNSEHALKITDLLLQGGGFGLVALDLGDISVKSARRIPSVFWFRFRRAIENTPTSLIVLEQESNVQSSACLVLEMKKESIEWSGAPFFRLLHGLRIQVQCHKPNITAEAQRGREKRFDLLCVSAPPR